MIYNLTMENTKLLETRNFYGLSQEEAAHILQVPTRTLRRYERDDNYGNPIKRNAFIANLIERCQISEEKGILSVDQIKNELIKLFDSEYSKEIEF